MTVDAFNWETAHRFGDALASQHRLRHHIFVQRQHYDVPVFNGLEYDQFDTPAATYVVRRDGMGIVRAVNRLIPTTAPYMLENLWPDLVADLPHTDTIWEGSRIGVDDRLPPTLRDRYFSELLCGVLEFGLSRGVSSYIGIMPAAIVKRTMIAAGLDIDLLSEARAIGSNWKVVALRINVTSASLEEVRRRKGIPGPLLSSASLAPSSLAVAA